MEGVKRASIASIVRLMLSVQGQHHVWNDVDWPWRIFGEAALRLSIFSIKVLTTLYGVSVLL